MLHLETFLEFLLKISWNALWELLIFTSWETFKCFRNTFHKRFVSQMSEKCNLNSKLYHENVQVLDSGMFIYMYCACNITNAMVFLFILQVFPRMEKKFS